MTRTVIKWVVCLVIMIVFAKAIYLKVRDAFEAIYIFAKLGDWLSLQWFSDYGAYGVAALELLVIFLLLTPWRFYGAILSACIMAGALFAHLLTPLGTVIPEYDSVGNVVSDDGGLLFYVASTVLVASLCLATLEYWDRYASNKSLPPK